MQCDSAEDQDSAKMATLDDSLAEVMAWFQAKYGRELEDCEDEQEPLYDAQGTA